MTLLTLRSLLCIPLLLGAGMAFAADVVPPYTPPPPTAPPQPPRAIGYDWSGFYAGIAGGHGWGRGTVENDGWLGGGYAGVNVQRDSNVVLGVEVDGTLTSKSGTSATTTVSNPWNATLRGRLGYAVNRLMVYATGGLAVGGVTVEDSVGPTDESDTLIGWTAGAGVETAMTDTVIGRVEYRYTDLGSSAFAPGTIRSSSHDIMVGVGIKF